MKIAFYYLPIANQVAVELKLDLEDEPPEPIFPAAPPGSRKPFGRRWNL